MKSPNRLVETIGHALAPHGFRWHQHPRFAALGVEGFWRRCTWNTNRAVAVVRWPGGDSTIGRYCQQLKWKLLRCTRFVPFLYEPGLQVVVVGDLSELPFDDTWALREAVDKIDNQLVVLQSIFAVDETSGRYACARTWAQFVTGKFQDAIAAGIEAAGIKSVEPV